MLEQISGTPEGQSHTLTFNLVDDPWLPCLHVDGTVTTLSLRELLHQAHQIQDLVLDVPTQYPPIVRLVLAVLHRAVGSGGQPGPRTIDEWLAIWGQGRLPGDQIHRYLDQVRHRFDLFHPEAPFAQVAGLRSPSGETKTIALVIPYLASGNNTPLFSTVRDQAPPSLTPPEAARWLLHAHAWDTAAIKTAAAGDPKAKAGKTTGNPTGPLGQLGVLIPTGQTLWHTLMYNLLVLNNRCSGSGDVPSWERPPVDATWRERTPAGLLDLYTWLGRRIRLLVEHTPDGPRVRRIVLCAGDRLRTADLDGMEPHTAWRQSKAQTAKLGRTVFMPVTHRPGRQLWRGLGTILAHEKATAPPDFKFKPADALVQLRVFADGPLEEHLKGHPLLLRAIGMTYGTQSAVINETYFDDLPLPVAVLRSDSWETVALDGVRDAEATARHLGHLATNLAKAAGCRDDRVLDGRRDNTQMSLYATLDPEFRRWIATLGEGEAHQEPRALQRAARDRWRSKVRAEAFRIADELLLRVPATAVRGRLVRIDRDRTEWLSAALAEFWFRRALNKDLPRPDQEA
ncbi:type I-E CRISPR-associated protein Cse1/CasA [Actinomadura oligospora]|uniref:type I-E CRISPR-associated protein Cse1/CasA n=1 Tax=Actinomadura oligospora TaxID=111804 RepID=UPI0004B78D40|nr:type I-E CRISPR-associated protein Cse1/CasA [Actinomadura oligospora]